MTDSNFNILYAMVVAIYHDLSRLNVNISDIAIITIKNVDYRCIIHNISKSEAIDLLKNSVPEDLYIKYIFYRI